MNRDRAAFIIINVSVIGLVSVLVLTTLVAQISMYLLR
jgi:hypothetical protein